MTPHPGDLGTLVAPWTMEEEGVLAKTRVFTLRQRYCTSPTSPDRSGHFVYLDVVDWVNVVALTNDDHVLLIEQFRQGLGEITLEVPGGAVNSGETPLAAGLRELSEETGYSGENAEIIGVVTPNPAIQNNRAHTVVVRNVTRTSPQHLDANEEIAVRMVPLAQIPELITSGRINHALVVAAFMHLGLVKKRASAAGSGDRAAIGW